MRPGPTVMAVLAVFWVYFATRATPAAPVNAMNILCPLALIWFWPAVLALLGYWQEAAGFAKVALAWTVLPLCFGAVPWLIHLILPARFLKESGLPGF